MRLMNLLFVLAFPFIASVIMAQPAEYEQIYSLIKQPDELVVAEFSVVGRNSIFSLELNSQKSAGEIKNMFLEGTGLKMISAVFQPPMNWKLILTNSEAEELPVEKLEQALEMSWNNKPGRQPSFNLTDKELVVTTYPTDPAALSHNLEIARAAGMKFSGSEPSPDTSSAIFTLSFNDPDTESIQSNQEVDQLAAEFSEFATVLNNETIAGIRNYKLSTSLDQVGKLLELPARFNRSLKFVSVNSLNQKQAQVQLKVVDFKSDMRHKLEVIKNLLQKTPIQWAENGFNTAAPVMTGFETDFGGKIALTGISPKSSLIFSQFFSMVERCQDLKNPFFSRGTYQETDGGRVMVFRVDCDW